MADRVPTLVIPNAITVDGCDALLEAAGAADHIQMPHRTLPAFMVGMKACAKFAREWLGPDVSGLGSEYFAASAGSATHLDNDFVQALPGSFMSVWLALDDVTDRNGPLFFTGDTRPLLCKKGDAIIIDGDTPHRSCAGHGPRPVALFTYIKAGFPFRPGKTQQRAEVAV